MLRYFLTRDDARGLAWRASSGAALALACSCTTFEPGTDELPDRTTLIQQQTPAPGRDWSCLREPTAPGRLVNSPIGAQALVQSLQVTDLASGLVPPGVAVRACSQRDLECTSPITGSLRLDEAGWVTLPLYEGFDGYIEITADTLVPTLLIYADPLTVDTQVDITPLGVVTNALLPSLTLATGVQQDLSLGLVHMRVFDCRRAPASGVTFSIDQSEAWGWYFVGELPTAMADETTESGLGGFINVTPGVAVVTAELPGSPIPIAYPKTLPVRPGWFTGLRYISKTARQ